LVDKLNAMDGMNAVTAQNQKESAFKRRAMRLSTATSNDTKQVAAE